MKNDKILQKPNTKSLDRAQIRAPPREAFKFTTTSSESMLLVEKTLGEIISLRYEVLRCLVGDVGEVG